MIYLDHNATTPVLPEVFEAMLPYLTTEWGNPSSTYKFGCNMKKATETEGAQATDQREEFAHFQFWLNNQFPL